MATRGTSKYWFKARKNNFGWTPANLEGWVTFLTWIAIFFYSFVEVHKDFPLLKQNIIAGIPTVAFSTLIFALILYKKGEPWK